MRKGEVNDIRFILDVWSRRRLHLACANGHAGWTYVQSQMTQQTTDDNGDNDDEEGGEECRRTYEKHERKEGAKQEPVLCLVGR